MGERQIPSILKPFFEEIDKYAAGVHELNDGSDEVSIAALEKEMNVRLPSLYKDFLKVCNGGELFSGGTILGKVYNLSEGSMKQGVFYLNRGNRPEHKWPGMPSYYFTIADTNYGDIICINLNSSNGQDCEIVQWSHESGKVSKRWNSLLEWLKDELYQGVMMFDYDGNLKD